MRRRVSRLRSICSLRRRMLCGVRRYRLPICVVCGLWLCRRVWAVAGGLGLLLLLLLLLLMLLPLMGGGSVALWRCLPLRGGGRGRMSVRLLGMLGMLRMLRVLGMLRVLRVLRVLKVLRVQRVLGMLRMLRMLRVLRVLRMLRMRWVRILDVGRGDDRWWRGRRWYRDSRLRLHITRRRGVTRNYGFASLLNDGTLRRARFLDEGATGERRSARWSDIQEAGEDLRGDLTARFRAELCHVKMRATIVARLRADGGRRVLRLLGRQRDRLVGAIVRKTRISCHGESCATERV